MRYINKLPNAADLIKQYPLLAEEIEARKKTLQSIKKILNGLDKRKLLIIGPCSADREDAVLEYVEKLCNLKKIVEQRFLIIPRIYTGKPRTNGKGYKGLIHRPFSSSGQDNILAGIIAMRKMHLQVIRRTGMFPADELLYPETYSYVEDLLIYTAVGARSVEDQQHRLIASGMDIPVGMKNPTSGNLSIMLNSIVAAQSQQRLIFDGWEVETDGNLFAHAILRGYTDSLGKCAPNYHYENLCRFHDQYYKMNLRNPSVIIDCNHSNSDKKYMEQIRIAEDVMHSCKCSHSIDKFVKGLMIESYLEDGNQMIGEGVYGKSITDPCLGLEKTKILFEKLME